MCLIDLDHNPKHNLISLLLLACSMGYPNLRPAYLDFVNAFSFENIHRIPMFKFVMAYAAHDCISLYPETDGQLVWKPVCDEIHNAQPLDKVDMDKSHPTIGILFCMMVDRCKLGVSTTIWRVTIQVVTFNSTISQGWFKTLFIHTAIPVITDSGFEPSYITNASSLSVTSVTLFVHGEDESFYLQCNAWGQILPCGTSGVQDGYQFFTFMLSFRPWWIGRFNEVSIEFSYRLDRFLAENRWITGINKMWPSGHFSIV